MNKIAYFAYCVVIAVAFALTVMLCVRTEHKQSVTFQNAQRYAVENDCECYGSKGSYLFVFSNGHMIGSETMYGMYE